jgi:hypothetical protein
VERAPSDGRRITLVPPGVPSYRFYSRHPYCLLNPGVTSYRFYSRHPYWSPDPRSSSYLAAQGTDKTQSFFIKSVECNVTEGVPAGVFQ